MTATPNKPNLEESQPTKPGHGKLMDSARARDAAVQVDVEDSQLAYLADSAVVNFGLPPPAASLCTPARLRQLHHLEKIRLPSPRRHPTGGEAFAEVLDWIARRLPVKQEDLLKAHPKVVINHTQRVLDAEFRKLEKGLLPDLAADDVFLDLLHDVPSQPSPRSRSLDDPWYSFPTQAQSPTLVDTCHGGRCPVSGSLPDYELPTSSPILEESFAAQHEQRDQEHFLRRPITGFQDDFIHPPWAQESFRHTHSYHESPTCELEHLSPECPTFQGHFRETQTRDQSISPLALSMDSGFESHLNHFLGMGQAPSHADMSPLELPRSRRPEMTLSRPLLLPRQQPWSPHSHM